MTTLYRCLWVLATLANVFVTANVIAPKVVIIDMYNDEQNIWYGIPEFNLLERNITVPGLSPLFPSVHCTADQSVCQIVVGEGQVNAAASMSAFVNSPVFDLTKSYFLIAGDAGISPKVGTLASVTFARFSVQVALQYEVDAREKPDSFPTGYVPLGATSVNQYPTYIYGTEVIELNDALRQRAVAFAQKARLNDSASAQAYRATYSSVSDFAPALKAPSVIACDTATSDVWWTGNLLGAAFENTTKLFTNGHATYCTTQQEDTGTLEPLLRGAATHRLDFSRIMLMRTASDFDRQAPQQSALDNLFNGQDAGYDPAVLNIYLAGVQVVKGILNEWNTFSKGIQAQNYLGDILGTLGGSPDFGPSASPPQKRRRGTRR